jgi:multiple sugar transport system permease protein
MDNVIMKKNPQFVGFAHYIDILTSDSFHGAVVNTLFFTGASVIAHLVIGLVFALLLNTDLLGNRTKAVFRMIYILPWLFTVAIIAILWRLLLAPNGVVNYVLTSSHLIGSQIAWLAEPQYALLAVTFINIWSGYPFYMTSLLAGLQGIPTRPPKWTAPTPCSGSCPSRSRSFGRSSSAWPCSTSSGRPSSSRSSG